MHTVSLSIRSKRSLSSKRATHTKTYRTRRHPRQIQDSTELLPEVLEPQSRPGSSAAKFPENETKVTWQAWEADVGHMQSVCRLGSSCTVFLRRIRRVPWAQHWKEWPTFAELGSPFITRGGWIMTITGVFATKVVKLPLCRSLAAHHD